MGTLQVMHCAGGRRGAGGGGGTRSGGRGGLASHTLGPLTCCLAPGGWLPACQGPACPGRGLCGRAGPEAGRAGLEHRRRLHGGRLMGDLWASGTCCKAPARCRAGRGYARLGGLCAPAKRPAALRTASSPPSGRHRRFLCNLAPAWLAHEMDGALSGLAHYCNSQQSTVIGQQRPGTPTSNPPSKHFPTLAQPAPLRSRAP